MYAAATLFIGAKMAKRGSLLAAALRPSSSQAWRQDVTEAEEQPLRAARQGLDAHRGVEAMQASTHTENDPKLG